MLKKTTLYKFIFRYDILYQTPRFIIEIVKLVLNLIWNVKRTKQAKTILKINNKGSRRGAVV